MRWAALPRAINAGKPLAMADLRAFLAAEGMTEVKTLLASGNAIFCCDMEDSAALEARLHAASRDRLKLDTLWFVRNHADLAASAAANPFPDAAASRPNRVQVLFHHAPIAPAVIDALLTHHAGPERLQAVGRELYVDYPDGVGTSKLPSVMAKAKLPPSTGRNWNTLLKLVEATA